MLKKSITIVLLVAAAFGFASLALAQDGTTNSPDAAQTAPGEVHALIKELRQKSAELDVAYQQALQANPDLQQQQDAFVAKMRQAVKDQGYDIEAGQKRLEEMAGKLKSQDLSEDERSALMQKFTAERQALAQARSAALQQPDIQQAGQALQTATVAAMTAQNPEVEQLLQDIHRLRQQLRAAMQQPSAGQ